MSFETGAAVPSGGNCQSARDWGRRGARHERPRMNAVLPARIVLRDYGLHPDQHHKSRIERDRHNQKCRMNGRRPRLQGSRVQRGQIADGGRALLLREKLRGRQAGASGCRLIERELVVQPPKAHSCDQRQHEDQCGWGTPNFSAKCEQVAGPQCWAFRGSRGPVDAITRITLSSAGLPAKRPKSSGCVDVASSCSVPKDQRTDPGTR